jgi:hypothetical protein
MTLSRLHVGEAQIQIGASLGIAHVIGALLVHFTVPSSLEGRLGLVADPWFRRETGTVKAGFAYGLFGVLRGERDATFLRSTAIGGLLMAAVRTSDAVLGVGGLVLARQFERR